MPSCEDNGLGHRRYSRRGKVLPTTGYSRVMSMLTNYCRRLRACSFYASRELADSADLILCPYNYLLDPVIKKTMGVCQLRLLGVC